MKQVAIFVCAFAVLFQLCSGAYAGSKITSDTSGTRVISDIGSVIGSLQDKVAMIRTINTAFDDAIEGITEIIASFDVVEEGSQVLTEMKETLGNACEEIVEIMSASVADIKEVPEKIKTIAEDALNDAKDLFINSGFVVDGSTAVKDFEEIIQNLIDTILEAIDA